MYSGPCILTTSLQPEKYGLKLKVVLKWRDIYVENIRKMLLIAGLKIEEIVKCGEGVLSCRDHCISIL